MDPDYFRNKSWGSVHGENKSIPRSARSDRSPTRIGEPVFNSPSSITGLVVEGRVENAPVIL